MYIHILAPKHVRPHHLTLVTFSPTPDCIGVDRWNFKIDPAALQRSHVLLRVVWFPCGAKAPLLHAHARARDARRATQILLGVQRGVQEH